LEAFGLEQATPVIRETVSSPSNWKYALDTYFENYHLPSLHRDTFAHVFAHNLTVFETFGPHMRFTYPQQSFVDWKDKPSAEWPIDSLPIQHFLYPNTVLVLGSVSPSGSLISIHRLFPQSVSEVATKITLFAPYGVQSPAHEAEIEASFKAIMGAVVNEDYSVTGESYASLAAMPAGTKLPFGRLEAGVQHLHGKFRDAVG
jgi:hypothetical protein